MAQKAVKGIVKKEVIFSCFAFFCMSFYTSLYGAVTAFIMCLMSGTSVK
jgi:hypothetical protein